MLTNIPILFLFFTFLKSVLTATSDICLPEEVIRRSAGMSISRKKLLIGDNTKLVYMSKFTNKDIITTPICEGDYTDDGKNYKYFGCPVENAELSGLIKNFCCGFKGKQRCCTINEYKSNVQVIKSDLVANTSSILSIILGSFNALVISSILIYYIMGKAKKNKPKSMYTVPAQSIPYNYVSYPSKSDLTAIPRETQPTSSENKYRHRMQGDNVPSILSKSGTTQSNSSVIVPAKPMKKKF